MFSKHLKVASSENLSYWGSSLKGVTNLFNYYVSLWLLYDSMLLKLSEMFSSTSVMCLNLLLAIASYRGLSK